MSPQGGGGARSLHSPPRSVFASAPFKKLRRLRRRQRGLKNDFKFNPRISLYSKDIFLCLSVSKSSRNVHSLDNAELDILSCCFVEDGKEMYQEL